jgi:bifunctional DNA-binding transcriptional regulator/antitoxin component of YhaV-PrlF toxin-antitoxin module
MPVATASPAVRYCSQKHKFHCMTALVKKHRLSIPEAVIKKAGIKPGDLVAFTVRPGAITVSTTTLPDESRHPLYTPTKAEARAIARGRAAYKRGDYITLNQLHDELDANRHKARKKITRKAS